MFHLFHKKYKGFLFLMPSLMGITLFVLVPFMDVVIRSFQTSITKEFNGLKNYISIFHNQAFHLAVKNTVQFTVVCLPILIFLSLFAAMAISQLREMKLLKSAFLLPMAVPAATLVLIWKMLFFQQGIFNKVLLTLGLKPIAFIDSGAAFWVLVLSYVWKNLGYTIVLWLAGILQISNSILEAGKVDGASPMETFLYIIIPNLKPTLYIITILSFLNSFKVFREAYLAAGSYPHESIYLLQHLFNNWFTNLEVDKMSASAVLIAALLFCVILFLQLLYEKDK